MSNTIGPNQDARIGGTFEASFNMANRLGGIMNIPEMVMAIQIERGNILESQVIDQMKDMQKRNEWLREANAALAAMRAAIPGADDNAKSYGTYIDNNGKEKSVWEFCVNNGIPLEKNGDLNRLDKNKVDLNALAKNVDTSKLTEEEKAIFGPLGVAGFVSGEDKAKGEVQGMSRARANIIIEKGGLTAEQKRAVADAETGNKSDFEQGINTLKSAIDTANTNSQLDQVRLQGLMDKRDNGFTMMTNLLSKTNKSLDAILGNMR